MTSAYRQNNVQICQNWVTAEHMYDMREWFTALPQPQTTSTTISDGAGEGWASMYATARQLREVYIVRCYVNLIPISTSIFPADSMVLSLRSIHTYT